MRKHYTLYMYDRADNLMFSQSLGYVSYLEASTHGEALQNFYGFGSYYSVNED